MRKTHSVRALKLGKSWYKMSFLFCLFYKSGVSIFSFLESNLWAQFKLLGEGEKGRETDFSEFEVFAEAVIVFWIVQTIAARIEWVNINAVEPDQVPQIPAEANFGCDAPNFIKMVDYLEILEVVEIDVARPQCPFQIKAGAIEVWVWDPASFFESLLQITVPANYDKHLRVRRKPLLLLPLLQVRNEWVWSDFPLDFFCWLCNLVAVVFFVRVFVVFLRVDLSRTRSALFNFRPTFLVWLFSFHCLLQVWIEHLSF